MSKVKSFIGKNIYKALYTLSALIIPNAYRASGWEKQQYQEIPRYLLEKLALDQNDIVLDFGCGTGVWDRIIAPRVEKLIGLDHLPGMVKRAKKVTANFSNVEIILHKSKVLPFENNTFSKVICCGVFQYFPDFEYAKQIMKEVFKITKRGGKVFIFDIIDQDKQIFPKYGSKDIFHPITYFLKILQYYFACACSLDEILGYCRSKGMIPHVLEDAKVFITDRESFSLSVEVVK